MRAAQAALDAFRQVLKEVEERHGPVFNHAAADLRRLNTKIDDMLALGLARFIGCDLQVIENPVTSGNWRNRLGVARAWSKMSDRERVDGAYLFERDQLTPEEFMRARAIIEKLEKHGRQGVLDLDWPPLDPREET